MRRASAAASGAHSTGNRAPVTRAVADPVAVAADGAALVEGGAALVEADASVGAAGKALTAKNARATPRPRPPPCSMVYSPGCSVPA